ncbi:MAG: hypothetical protein R3B67_09490 [Phycisphaerales bacterium]
MDPNRENTSSEAPPMRGKHKPSSSSDPRAEMKMRKPEEDVLDVIESVESQLGALRKAHEEHRQAMVSLHEQKIYLQEQNKELELREQELVNREVELAEMRQEFENRELNLVQRASGLEQRESKLAAQAESLEQHEAELESRDQEIKRKIAQLDEQLGGIAQRKGELDALEREVQEKLEREEEAAIALEHATAELEAARDQLRAQDEKYQQLQGELGSLREQHGKISADLKSATSKLRGREIELLERSKALEELAEQAGGVEHQLSEAREQFEKELAQVREALNNAQQQLQREQKVAEGLRAQLESLQHEQSSGNAQAQQRVSELESQLSEAMGRIESFEGEAEQRSAQNQNEIDTLSSQLQNAQGQIRELNAQLADIGADADEELTRQRELASEFEQQVASLRQELEQAQSVRDELQLQLDTKPEGDPEATEAITKQLEEARQQGEALQAKLGERESQLKQLAERVVALEAELEASGESSGESSGEPDEQTLAKIESLETQCSDLIATVEKLNSDLEAERAKPKGTGAAPSDEWTQRRRERLQRMRRVLEGDAEKVRLATNALQTRYEQCEQVLTKRAELAEAYEAIATAQRKVRNKEVRSGVLVGLFGMIAVMLMIGVGSWFVSGRVAPGEYSSRVTLSANSPDGKLSETELSEWEGYITGLISEPRFQEVAAERMKRRGIIDFATPGELGQQMDQSLDIVASMPGEIVLEYRDMGAERAQRVLDTFSVALSSAANNARARRGDSAITAVSQSATLSNAPLDTKRLEMAGMIIGGAMIGALIIGGILWRRLAAARPVSRRTRVLRCSSMTSSGKCPAESAQSTNRRNMKERRPAELAGRLHSWLLREIRASCRSSRVRAGWPPRSRSGRPGRSPGGAACSG